MKPAPDPGHAEIAGGAPRQLRQPRLAVRAVTDVFHGDDPYDHRTPFAGGGRKVIGNVYNINVCTHMSPLSMLSLLQARMLKREFAQVAPVVEAERRPPP